MGNDSALVYGNIGVWLSTDGFKTFQDWNTGFPNGIDNRKISKILYTEKKQLFAATYFGLYKFSFQDKKWHKLVLQGEEERITDLIEKQGNIIAQTRSYLLTSIDGKTFTKRELPAPVGYQKKTGLFNTLWMLHSGEMWGTVGKLLVDLFGLVVIFVAVTGLLHFLFPKLLKRRKGKEKSFQNLKITIKSNLKWHNKIGYIFVFFLIVTTITGMFLRPPLLIPIANTKIKPIPGTELDSPNPWYNKLRRILWDEERRIFLLSTSEGLFFADEKLQQELYPAENQPPVSVMGCNVLDKRGNNYLVGSFSGLFLWNPFAQMTFDYTTGLPYEAPVIAGPPISKDMVDGLFKDRTGNEIMFDYNQGAKTLSGNIIFPEMPESIITSSPMSLWNLALETHTGRIFEPYIGMFYILYIPLAGLCILIVLVSGFFVWWLGHRKKNM